MQGGRGSSETTVTNKQGVISPKSINHLHQHCQSFTPLLLSKFLISFCCISVTSLLPCKKFQSVSVAFVLLLSLLVGWTGSILVSWAETFPEKADGQSISQLLQTKKLTAVFTTTYHWTLSWTRLIHFIPAHLISIKFVLILPFPVLRYLLTGLALSDFPIKIVSPHITRSQASQSSWFGHLIRLILLVSRHQAESVFTNKDSARNHEINT